MLFKYLAYKIRKRISSFRVFFYVPTKLSNVWNLQKQIDFVLLFPSDNIGNFILKEVNKCTGILTFLTLFALECSLVQVGWNMFHQFCLCDEGCPQKNKIKLNLHFKIQIRCCRKLKYLLFSLVTCLAKRTLFSLLSMAFLM